MTPIRWTHLARLRESPAHYRHAVEHGRDDTAAFAAGRLVHVLALQPDRLDELYAIWDGERRAGRAWEEWRAAHADREIVRAADVAEARAIADAVRAHPLVEPLFADAVIERRIEWSDAPTGLPCCAQPDLISGGVLIDLKTTRSTEARRFAAATARYGYHCQLAHYAAGLRACGHKVRDARIVAVEKEPPHDVVVYGLDADGALYAGEEERRELLDRLAECLRTDTWPGRYDRVQTLELPRWAFPDDDEVSDVLDDDMGRGVR